MNSSFESKIRRNPNGEFATKDVNRIPHFTPATDSPLAVENKKKVLGSDWDNPVKAGSNKTVWESCDPDLVETLSDRFDNDPSIDSVAATGELAIAVTDEPLEKGYTSVNSEAATWDQRRTDLAIDDDPDSEEYRSNKEAFDREMEAYGLDDTHLNGLRVNPIGDNRNSINAAIRRASYETGNHVALVSCKPYEGNATADELSDQLDDGQELYGHPYVYEILV